MTIVLHRHFRSIDYCSRGMRLWCARFGVNYSEFLKHGIDAEKLRSFGENAMAERAIAVAEQEEAERGQQ